MAIRTLNASQSQKSGHCDWSTRVDLLPMASGKSERNHIFLAVAAPFAEVLDSLAQSFEECGVIYHAAPFTFPCPYTPRPDPPPLSSSLLNPPSPLFTTT